MGSGPTDATVYMEEVLASIRTGWADPRPWSLPRHVDGQARP